jgi:predicted MPP superfamily phosphohydrolase
MPRTALLRYSNIEQPSIALHEAVIAASGYVWWGWWKKETEPFLRELFEHLSENAGREAVRIGLLNRKDGEYYAAHCTDVAFDGDGNPLACPEPASCPDYYRAEQLRGWFKFEAFDRLDAERFRMEFGAIPQLDPTMYDVRRTGSDFEIFPRPTWSMEPRELTGSRILHLSDLHFGEFHGFPETDSGSSIGQRSLGTILRKRLSSLSGARVGAVVISGDLVSKGDANAFSPAKDFLDAVTDVLGLEREDVVIVPGNHDIWLQNVDHPTRDYAHEKPYREFLEAYYHREIQDLEWIQRFSADELDLTFFTLNSARLRTEDMKEYGFVGRHRYEDMLDFVARTLEGETAEARHVIAGVMHHHLVPVPLISLAENERPASLTLDAGELLDQFQRRGVGLVMHGHEHVPFITGTVRVSPEAGEIDWPSGERVVVVGAGSTGAAMPHLRQEAAYNTLGLYELKKEGMELLTERFTATSDPEPVTRVMIPWPT